MRSLSKARSYLTDTTALQELNATKDKFFSIIAHDLKNPFNVLLTLSEILSEELERYSAEDIRKWMRKMHQSAEQGYALLENLLEWARTQTGKIRFEPERIPLKRLVAEIIEFLENPAGSKQIAVYADIPDDLSLVADVKMLATILRNLALNAIKYTHPDGEVRIHAQASDEQIEITVSDTGVGMHEDQIRNLFRIDAHHSTAGTAQEKGTGLGLLLCKEFVEQHGGAIRIKSESGKGSDFTVVFPER